MNDEHVKLVVMISKDISLKIGQWGDFLDKEKKIPGAEISAIMLTAIAPVISRIMNAGFEKDKYDEYLSAFIELIVSSFGRN